MATEPKQRELQHFTQRQNFKLLQLSNPNYFGNIKDSKFQVVLPISGNTFYEELRCVSYHPALQMLNAAINVKQSSGYSGSACTNGSFEYVRFYVDYQRNGTWIDEGYAATNVHDLPFQEDLCYNVQLKMKPNDSSCCDDKPVLPRVRAILSWNSIPPANQPNFSPVWGNVFETNIQIAPSNSFWCKLKDGLVLDDINKLKLLKNIEKIELPPIPQPDPPPLSLQHLKATYKKEVEDSRILMQQVAAFSYDASISLSPEIVLPEGINWAEVLENISKLEFNTQYEEVRCIALNRELSSLHASVVIKRTTGYLGGLCKKGSKQYVAFYLDFGSGYQYMGTSSIAAHDIPGVPADGLWYNISLPVNLEPYQKEWCQSGKAKAKAILSWNVPPPPNNPNFVATYGDWEECHVEIKSLPKGIVPGVTKVSLESVGAMPIIKIDDTTGLANGGSVGGTFTAVESAFDGNVKLNGLLFFAGAASYQYRILLKRPSDAALHPVFDKVTLQTNTAGVISADIELTPDANGWMTYLGIPGTRTIVENYLGSIHPAVNGMHTVRVEFRDSATLVTYSSITKNFLADKDSPVVNIDMNAGSCKTFKEDTVITGTFSMSDGAVPHCHSLGLSVFPADKANGAVPRITAPVTGVSSMHYGVNLPGNGTIGTWELDTKPMTPCGFVVRITGSDRTIMHSGYIGHQAFDDEGFCLVP